MLPAILGLLFQLQAVDSRAGPVFLAGTWRFHRGDSIAWKSPHAPERDWQAITVPGTWTPEGHPASRRFRWYRLRLDPRAPPDRPLGVWLRPSLASAAFSAAPHGYAFHRIFDLDRFARPVLGPSTVFLVLVPVFLAVPSWATLAESVSFVFNPLLLLSVLVTLGLAVWQL